MMFGVASIKKSNNRNGGMAIPGMVSSVYK